MDSFYGDGVWIFLLQALFDLIVQSPMNKFKTTIHHLKQNKRRKPERTTAIPPARIAVLIQARNNTEPTPHTQQKQPKMVKAPRQWRKLYNDEKIKRSHTAIHGNLTNSNIPANREKTRSQSRSETNNRDKKETGCLSPSVTKKPLSLTVSSQYTSYNCASVHPGERNSIGGFRPFQTPNSGFLFSRSFLHRPGTPVKSLSIKGNAALNDGTKVCYSYQSITHH